MAWIDGIRRQFRLPVTQRDIDAEIEDEMRFHIDARVEELTARGIPEAEARTRATQEFGDLQDARAELTALGRRRARGEHRAEVLGDLVQDVRFAARTLARSRNFTGTAVLTLAIAVGVTTALVAIVDATLLRPLPFAAADELVVVNGVALPERDVRFGSYAEIQDWGALTRSFTAISIYDQLPYNLSDGTSGEQVTGETVSASYLDLLGVTPQLGRGIDPGDDVYGAERVVLISDRLWRERFGADRGVLGRTIQLDGGPVTVVGVLPPGFHGMSFDADVWLPLLSYGGPDLAQSRGGRWLGAVARLRPGVTQEAAQADIERAAAELAQRFPDSNTDRSADVVPLRESYLNGSGSLENTRTLLLAVSGAVLLLLLIAAVNVTNLQLVRGMSRSGEVAVRYALGAGRGRIVRQLVTESVVLSLIGGVIGIALAMAGTRLILGLLPADVLPPYATVSVDARVIAFALAVVTITGALSGLVPAFRTSASRMAGELRTARGTSRGEARAQHALVVTEVALALALLASAALMVRSLRAQLDIDPGFDATNVTAGRFMLIGDAYDTPGRMRFVATLLERLAVEPGVVAAAVTSDAPLRGTISASITAPADRPEAQLRYYRHRVTPGYFETLGISILRGRGIEARDHADAPPVVVVSEAFARRVFPESDALGSRLLYSSADTMTIVGIAENVRQRNLTTSLFDPTEDPDMYFSLQQLPAGGLDIVVRGDRAPIDADVLHAAARSIDPTIPVFNVEPLRTTLAAQTANARFGSMLLGAFALIALGLAAVGIYGVMAYLVHARRREIAVRMAMGAALGAVLALAAGRTIASLLYGIRPIDPASLAAAVATLAICALGATLLPALRAVRTDPQLVLRGD